MILTDSYRSVTLEESDMNSSTEWNFLIFDGIFRTPVEFHFKNRIPWNTVHCAVLLVGLGRNVPRKP